MLKIYFLLSALFLFITFCNGKSLEYENFKRYDERTYIKPEYEGVATLKSPITMNIGEIKEFKLMFYTQDEQHEVIPDSDINITSFKNTSTTSEPDIVSLEYDENNKILKLTAKAIGKSSITIGSSISFINTKYDSSFTNDFKDGPYLITVTDPNSTSDAISIRKFNYLKLGILFCSLLFIFY
ncbi:hypothetical protein BCR32DRAFT_328716 [Anaeromyces robustus]|uniref:Uncharacterized protein n=1 Tax=Anaeromyces robustus TaxID=1754192 RepID=A0A1Y1WWN2_9FUNG|nr:hypothetical protein BCR32DRAFT_328716 [Anaeromyces robustus]|eukprot:ORX77923.1 hypothetical protein BCR32DRAFT_328716 [Anaeromyces robustus]